MIEILPYISGQPHGREGPVAEFANDFVLTMVKQVAKMHGDDSPWDGKLQPILLVRRCS